MSNNVEAVKKIADEINELLANVLKNVNLNIDYDKNIATLGFDSVRILILLQRINKKFNLQLSLEDLSAHSSINSLARIIEEKIRNTPQAGNPN